MTKLFAAGLVTALFFALGSQVQAAAMGIVAVLAVKLALCNRMMRRHIRCRPDFTVTFIAKFRRGFPDNLFRFGMNRMTAGTVDIGGIVMRKRPVVERFALVTVQTGFGAAELIVFGGVDNQLGVTLFNMSRTRTVT